MWRGLHARLCHAFSSLHLCLFEFHGTVCICRARRAESHIQQMLWKVNYSDIVFINTVRIAWLIASDMENCFRIIGRCSAITEKPCKSSCLWRKVSSTGQSKKKRVKSFPSLTAHWAALISVPLALSQTPVYTAKTADMGPVHRAVCPFTPRRLGRYQIILLGDWGTWVWTTCPELLPGSGTAGDRTHDLSIMSLTP